MKKDFKPVCIRFVKETQTGLKYEMQDHDVDLELSIADRKTAVNFLYFCNGKEKLEDIAKEINVKVSVLIPLVKILIKHNIILNSNEIFKYFHEASSIPGPYVQNLVGKQSYKTFSEQVLPLKKILRILNVLSLSVQNHQLDSFITLNRTYGGLLPGLYKFNTTKKELINLSKITNTKLNKFLFTSDVAVNASAIIFVVANHKLSSSTYTNRSYRYLFLESGKVKQIAYQVAAKEKAFLVECDEFNDKAISSFLNLGEYQITYFSELLTMKNE
jgi:hypothetical protein